MLDGDVSQQRVFEWVQWLGPGVEVEVTMCDA